MTTGRSEGGAARLLDGTALGLFAAHAALRLSLGGGDGSWGANLAAHLLVPLSAAVWLTARALERRLPWRLSGFEVPLAALAALSLITSFGAPYRLGALDGTAGWCAAALAVPLAIHLFGPPNRTALFSILLAVTTVIVLYGGIQFLQLGEARDSSEAQLARDAANDEGELATRIAAREPWSTFNKYPNTFGGFLVLALPFLIGTTLDSKSRGVRIAGLLIAGVGLFCLGVTGALGAGVASIAAALAFFVLLVVRGRPAWRRGILLASGASVVLAAALVAAGPLSPKALAKRSVSLTVRDVYWDAAARVAKAHPFGVGLNNFEDLYYVYKDDRQEEVRHVHNDYLQVLVELGIPGLLAFLGLMAVAIFKALKPATPEPSALSPALGVPVGAGLVFGWIAAAGLQGVFGDIWLALALAAAGLGAYQLFSKRGSFGDFSRIGLIAGLAGVAVHFLVDFDLPDPAFRHFFFLALAALALSSPLESPSHAGPAIPAIGAIVLFAIALPLAALVAPRFLEADDQSLDGSIAASQGRFDDADLHREAAAEANLLDPGPAVERALSEYVRWAASPGETRRAELAITILEDAIRRRPRYAAIEARLAEVQEAVARHQQGATTGIDAAAARALLQESERHARRAVELYPTRSYHRYLLGRILDASGRSTEAADEYREALRLGGLARRVPRLALDGVQAAVATLGTGGTQEQAVAIFQEWRKKQAAHPGFEDRWRARIPLLAPPEKAIVDAAADLK